MDDVLLNFLIDRVINHVVDPFIGCRMAPTFQISDLDYTDDIVVLRETQLSLQPTIDEIAECAVSVDS